MVKARTMLQVATVMVFTSTWIGAARADPEGKCQAGRHKAAAHYASCQQLAQATANTRPVFDFQKAISKCLVRYTASWPKLMAKPALAGSSCTAARAVDNGDGIVTDNLTGLQWEQKTNSGVHNVGNVYSWSTNIVPYIDANGTAFTDFLSSLNSGVCFAGQCDWRLPTRDELQTILNQSFPCATNPCIDALYGPTRADYYWSTTPAAPINVYAAAHAWAVYFLDGTVGAGEKKNAAYVRAVRGGF